MSYSVLPVYFSKSLMHFGLIFRCLIYFEFIFVYGVKKCSNFILLHGAVQFSQHHLLKTIFAPLYILTSFVKKTTTTKEKKSYPWI